MKTNVIIIAITLCIGLADVSVAQVPSYVPTSGLVGWWEFNGNANDGSGNSNNGTVTGATLTTDRFGSINSAYSFNGTSDYIDAPLINPLNTSNINGLTLSGWCNLSVLNSINSILSITDVSVNKLYGILFDGQSAAQFRAYNGVNGSAATMIVNGVTTTSANTWYNVVLTCDYSNNTSKLYINGILQNQSSVILNKPIVTSVHIGAWVTFNGYWYAHGKLDDLGIWNRALTICEVQSLYYSNTFPAMTSSSSNPICAGLSSTLSAIGANSYTWYPGSITGSSIVVTPSTTSNYTVLGTTTLTGCVFSNTLTQFIIALPQISVTSSNGSICAGETATLNVSGANSYTCNAVALNGSSLAISPTVSTTYTIIGTSSLTSCSNNNTLTQNVSPLPQVTVTSSSGTICIGETATLNATGANSYTCNAVVMSGASLAISPTLSTTYTVIGTSSLTGCSNSTLLSQNVSLCTDIKNNLYTHDETIKVFPNPNHGQFNISSEFDSYFEIINGIGQVMHRDVLNQENNWNFNITNLSPGIYFVIIHNQQITMNKKLIVN